MSVIEIESIDHYENELEHFVIIDYHANWCKSCSLITPELKLLAKKYKVNVLKVNVDEFPKLCKKIKSLPTITSNYNGIEIDRVVGADIHKIEKLFKS